MKNLLLSIVFVALSFGQSSPTLTASCFNCQPLEMVRFHGENYPQRKGSKDHYLACFSTNGSSPSCTVLPGQPDAAGVIEFDWGFNPGSYEICVQRWNQKGHFVLACAAVVVQ